MQEQTVTPDQIVKLFEHLPGDKAFKILAPGTRGRPKFEAQLDSDRMLFVASAIKTFVLCEAEYLVVRQPNVQSTPPEGDGI